MRAVASDTELDDLVWSLIKDSRNPLDFLDYLRHTFNSPGEQEEVFTAAPAHQENHDQPSLYGDNQVDQ